MKIANTDEFNRSKRPKTTGLVETTDYWYSLLDECVRKLLETVLNTLYYQKEFDIAKEDTEEDINVILNDRAKRVMDKAIEFVNINNLLLYI